MADLLRAPFPWNGGKSRVAEECWRAFGPDVVNYIEPFFGSGAVLLNRPGGAGKIETINDLDGGVVNFWRAIVAAPDEVAHWCDWPVSELDLHARHAWLVERLNDMADELRANPDFCCPKTAGWWVWGICQWIGTGWCGGIKHGEPRPNLNSGQGVHAGDQTRNHKRPELHSRHGINTLGTRELPHQRPHSSGDSAGMGVLSPKLPNLSGYEAGIRSGTGSQQLPSLRVNNGATGNGILASGLANKMPAIALNGTGSAETGRGALSEHAQRQHGPHQLPQLQVRHGHAGHGVVSSALRDSGLPAIGNDRGINGVAAPPCLAWFRALHERLRRVRIICGDWTRVLGPSVLGKGKNVGGRRPTAVLLDPPYDPSLRAKRIYNHDAEGLSAEVRAWALLNGGDPELRIALCGYAGEHEMPGWTEYAWKGARGYANSDNLNREKERIWFSPHCLPVEQQRSLFDVVG